MQDKLSTLYERAKEGREPTALDLEATADGEPVIAVGTSNRRAIFLPLGDAERVTENVDAIRQGTLLAEIRKDERAGVKDPVIYDSVGGLRFINGINVHHEDEVGEVINAEYIYVSPADVRQTEHNHQHLVRDGANAHEYFAFRSF